MEEFFQIQLMLSFLGFFLASYLVLLFVPFFALLLFPLIKLLYFLKIGVFYQPMWFLALFINDNDYLL